MREWQVVQIWHSEPDGKRSIGTLMAQCPTPQAATLVRNALAEVEGENAEYVLVEVEVPR